MDEEEIRMPSRYPDLDETLAAYLEHLWLDDFNITYAGHTLSALRRFYPQLRYRLPVARAIFLQLEKHPCPATSGSYACEHCSRLGWGGFSCQGA